MNIDLIFRSTETKLLNKNLLLWICNEMKKIGGEKLVFLVGGAGWSVITKSDRVFFSDGGGLMSVISSSSPDYLLGWPGPPSPACTWQSAGMESLQPLHLSQIVSSSYSLRASLTPGERRTHCVVVSRTSWPKLFRDSHNTAAFRKEFSKMQYQALDPV